MTHRTTLSALLALIVAAPTTLAGEPPTKRPAPKPVEAPDDDDDDLIAPEDDDIVPEDGEDETDKAKGERKRKGYKLRRAVTIEAKRERLLRKGGSVQTVSQDELEKTEFDDPGQVLAAVPSVQSRGEDGYGLRPNIGIRGTSSERSKKITLMEDGVLFGPAPYAAPAAYYFPLMTRMVGLDVFKGPAAIQYGPKTVGGAINLISRPVPYKPVLGADVAFGTDLYFKAHAFGGTTFFFDGAAGFGFLIEGTHVQTNGFKDVDGEVDADTGFSRTEVSAKARLHSDLDAEAVHTLDAKFTWSRENSQETYLGLSDSDFRESTYRRYAASHLDEMDWMRTSAQADYSFQVGNLEDLASVKPADRGDTLYWGVDLKATFYRHDFHRDWLKVTGFRDGPSLSAVLDNPAAGSNAVFYNILTGADDGSTEDEQLLLTNNGRSFASMGGQLTIAATFAQGDFRHELEAGLRVHADSIVRDHDGFYYRMESRRLVREGDGFAVLDNRGHGDAFAAYLRYGFRWKNLTLTPGIRLESIVTSLSDTSSDIALTNATDTVLGGIGAHYEVLDGFGVVFGVHQGFAPVAPGQPDDVQPETSLNWEAGLRYGDPKTGTLLEGIFFFNDYSNLNGQCSFSSGCDPDLLDSQFNAGEVDVMGVELVAAHTFEVGPVRVPLKLAYTYTHTAFQTDFTSVNPQFGKVRVGDAMPYVPEHAASLSMGAAMERWDLTLNLNMISPMREAAGSDDDAPMTDLRVSFSAFARVQVLEWLQIYTKFENLFVREDIVSRRPYGARPNRPLSAQLGLKFDY